MGGIAGSPKLVSPAPKLPPHAGALGMRFYTGTMFPLQYRNSIFIAEHGSWNRCNKIGYRIELAKIKNNKVVKQEVLAEGWLGNEKNWERRVGVL
jgi:glucose/arabinose dehydrogenase